MLTEAHTLYIYPAPNNSINNQQVGSACLAIEEIEENERNSVCLLVVYVYIFLFVFDLIRIGFFSFFILVHRIN